MKTVGEILRWRTRFHRDKEAVCHAGRRKSYSELNARTSQLANALISAGTLVQERVAVLDKGHDRLIETIFALSKAGAVYTPVNWRLAVPEIEQILKDAEIKTLFIGAEFEAAALSLKQSLPELDLVINYDGKGDDWVDYEDFLSENDVNDPRRDGDEDDTVWQVYTSGTTGLPKGVEVSHSNILSMCTSTDIDYSGEDNVVLASFFHLLYL